MRLRKRGGYFERRSFLAKEKGLGMQHVTPTPHPPLLLSSSLCRPLHTTNKTTHVYYPSLPQKTPFSKIKQNKILTCSLSSNHTPRPPPKNLLLHIALLTISQLSNGLVIYNRFVTVLVGFGGNLRFSDAPGGAVIRDRPRFSRASKRELKCSIFKSRSP
jgi:hypothetical protein